MSSSNPDFYNEDLFTNIDIGNFPSWTWYIQLIPEKEAETYKFDIYDITKVVPHEDYPLIEIGKLVLNKNPTNYFAEVE
jgi:catalase